MASGSASAASSRRMTGAAARSGFTAGVRAARSAAVVLVQCGAEVAVATASNSDGKNERTPFHCVAMGQAFLSPRCPTGTRR